MPAYDKINIIYDIKNSVLRSNGLRKKPGKDGIETTERPEQMLKPIFCSFAGKDIEAMPMQEFADACMPGMTAVRRRFNTKLSLVLAIGARK